MASVFKRGSTWWIRFSANGRQVRESARTTRKDEALALLAKRQSEVFANNYFPEKRRAARHTMSDLRDLWYEDRAQKKSLKNYRVMWRRINDALGPATRVADVRSEDVARFMSGLATSLGQRGKPLSANSIRAHWSLIRAAFALAESREWIPVKPFRGLRAPKEGEARDRIASPAEVERLLESADDELRLAIQLALETGMRRSEIVELTWGRVDLETRLIVLRGEHTKSSKGRKVPLSRKAVTALRAYPRRADGLIFTRVSNTIGMAFAELTKRLGITDLKFHDLRHTALTSLRRGGVDLLTIASISGHAQLRHLRRYQQIDADDLLQAVDRVSGSDDDESQG